jgi:hypothetical protein
MKAESESPHSATLRTAVVVDGVPSSAVLGTSQQNTGTAIGLTARGRPARGVTRLDSCSIW